MDYSDFMRHLSGEEFEKAGSDGRMYVFKNLKSDKDTLHIHTVQEGEKDDGKDLDMSQPKMSPTLLFYGMYWKPFIYRMNSTNYR